eukprot:767012-Hanusia_phi.AAC.6
MFVLKARSSRLNICAWKGGTGWTTGWLLTKFCGRLFLISYCREITGDTMGMGADCNCKGGMAGIEMIGDCSI